MKSALKLEKSFCADIYWKGKDQTLYKVAATMNNETVFKNNDGWLFAGKDNYTKRLSNGMVWDRYLVELSFWFGCYVFEDGRHLYRIAAFTRHLEQPDARNHRFNGHHVDISKNSFLGLYDVHPDYIRADRYLNKLLFQLDNMGTDVLRIGQVVEHVQLTSPYGRQVKVVDDEGYPLLNESGAGTAGSFTLKVLEAGQKFPFSG
ncbi:MULTISPECIES: hypothetical protein [unclassified Pseudomonas]|uniref:hypothetical protein n=1 Tax=unclassified Pseudomonas TaxID=196821 RepID=UPI001473373F|nr:MULTISPECIES: hypothetical protein [unclassified Pseudomonas]NMY35836.1 hypothetical protein [Pseudomonas sp. WS 5078]NMY58577.1 hypothetical protein [Pseudomonas sp. WS 5354]